MNIEELFCKKRSSLAIDRYDEKTDAKINEFERDYSEIISSSAFRRLQDKTQVFPLDKSDFIRTRLTHSIEVSTIAKQLGMMLKESQYWNGGNIDELPSLLACAGLLHDLGNPPFGHFGEAVIAEWFKSKFEDANFCFKGNRIKELFDEQQINDLENFEGNSQTFRLLSKIRTNDNGINLNLTYSVISTLIKYPVSSVESDKKNPDIRYHKMGYFLAEQDFMEEVAHCVGTKESDNKYYRNPFAFLLEAADDIAYATSDLEDSFKKNLFTLDQFIKFYNSVGKISVKSKEIIDLLCENRGEQEDEYSVFHNWLQIVKSRLQYVAIYSFTRNQAHIMNGTYEVDLFRNTLHEETIDTLQAAAVEFAFKNKNILKLEIAANEILGYLLDSFVNAVIYWDTDLEKEKMGKLEKKFVSIISSNYKEDYKNNKTENETYNLYLRFLMVIDYISGMTDSYAKNLYNELKGFFD